MEKKQDTPQTPCDIQGSLEKIASVFQPGGIDKIGVQLLFQLERRLLSILIFGEEMKGATLGTSAGVRDSSRASRIFSVMAAMIESRLASPNIVQITPIALGYWYQPTGSVSRVLEQIDL